MRKVSTWEAVIHLRQVIPGSGTPLTVAEVNALLRTLNRKIRPDVTVKVIDVTAWDVPEI
jgi:hypothetical protein